MKVLEYRAKDLVDFEDDKWEFNMVHAMCKGCGECMWSDDIWTDDDYDLMGEVMEVPENHKEGCWVFKKIQGDNE